MKKITIEPIKAEYAPYHWIIFFGPSKNWKFSNKRKADRFASKLGVILTNRMVRLNLIYSEAHSMSRELWPIESFKDPCGDMFNQMLFSGSGGRNAAYWSFGFLWKISDSLESWTAEMQVFCRERKMIQHKWKLEHIRQMIEQEQRSLSFLESKPKSFKVINVDSLIATA